MRRVAVAEFKDRASEFIASAEAGEEIEITRHGRVAARLVPPQKDEMEEQRRIIDQLLEAGRRIRAKGGPITHAEIREWIEEDRR
jgi:prevent-host-death family protein